MNQNENTHKSTLEEMNEYLEHHGIEGQKWGIRRTPEQLGHKIASGTKKQLALLAKQSAISIRKLKQKQPLRKR